MSSPNIIYQFYTNLENIMYTRSPSVDRNISYSIIYEIPMINSLIDESFYENIPLDIHLDNQIDNIEDFTPGIFNFFNMFSDLIMNNTNDIIGEEQPYNRNDRILSELGPYKRIQKDSELLGETCVICMDNYKLNEGYRTLNCGHKFHKKCIDKWLLNGSVNCPICRKEQFNKNK